MGLDFVFTAKDDLMAQALFPILKALFMLP